MVREAGLEPARPEWTLEPESSESANSTTRASCESLIIIAFNGGLVKRFFLFFVFFFRILLLPAEKWPSVLVRAG